VEAPLCTREEAEAARRKAKDVAWMMKGSGAQYVNFSPATKPVGQPMTASEPDTEAYQLNRAVQSNPSVDIGPHVRLHPHP
jgi:hypothetical protein